MARHLHTSTDAIEQWDIDQLLAYQESLARVVKAEQPTGKR